MERKSEMQCSKGLAGGRWMLEAPRELAVGRAVKKHGRICVELRRAETKPIHKQCVKLILTWMRYCSKGHGEEQVRGEDVVRTWGQVRKQNHGSRHERKRNHRNNK